MVFDEKNFFELKYTYNLGALQQALSNVPGRDFTIGQIMSLLGMLRSVDLSLHGGRHIVIGVEHEYYSKKQVYLLLRVCQKYTGIIIPPREDEIGSSYERVAMVGLEDLVADMEKWLEEQKEEEKKEKEDDQD